MDLSKICCPTLILNKEICIQNIERMMKKAKASDVSFRPHFKTHQSKVIGQWFREKGLNKITVSSVQMAEYFAADGWNDILIAFPFNPLETEKIEILQKTVNIGILASNFQACEIISKCITFQIDVFVEIEVGYLRSGFPYSKTEDIVNAIKILSQNKNIQLKGILSHFGNSYSEKITEIPGLWNSSVTKLKEITQKLNSLVKLQISVGDTPCCSVIKNFSDVDEVRPGNFVFYDVMQASKGICSFKDIAISVFCPVVDIHPERNEFIIYGGAVHFSKEFITNEEGDRNYGIICSVSEKGWCLPVKETFIKSLSQEHGIVHSTKEYIQSLKIGDLVAVLPIHACITAQCYKNYQTTEDDIIDHM